MTDPKAAGSGKRPAGAPDPLQDVRVLHAQIKGLKALLDLQRWQIEVLTDRLYSTQPGEVAARRLLALKRAGPAASRHDPAGNRDAS